MALRRMWGAFGGKREENQSVAKELLLYRNGDNKSRPTHFVFTKRKLRDWDELMDTIDALIKPLYEGKIEVLYTPRGRRKVTSLDKLDDTFQDNFVPCGAEGYIPIKGGYERLKNLPVDGTDETDAKIKEAQEFRKHHPVRRIYLREEHEDATRAKAYLISTRRKDHQNMEGLLRALNRQFKLESGENINYILTESGKEIRHVEELFVKQCYIMSSNQEIKEQIHNHKERDKSNKESRNRRHNRRDDSDDNADYGDSTSDGKPRLRKYKQNYDTDYANDYGSDYGNDHGHSTHESRKKRFRRLESSIFHRKSQIIRPKLMLFVFRNGSGSTARIFTFNRQEQRSGGWEHVLSHIAKWAGVKFSRSKLYTIDGNMKIASLDELIHKGCYVIAQKDQRFRETWYIMPKGSKDTSVPSDDEDEE